MNVPFQPNSHPPLSHKSWLPYLIIVLVIIILAIIYLWPSAWEFPMDDSYIHFVYAQNLSRYGKLMFNQPGESGVGTTSLTWVVLLAGAFRLGIPTHLAAKVLGLASLAAAGCEIYLLFRPILSRAPALVLALLVSGSGHFLWFALSGMETMLFMALGLLALLLYREKRWVALGGALGLLVLTRPDGLALAGAIGAIEVWKNRRRPKNLLSGLLTTGLICLLVCGPWFGYLLARTGHLLPTSAVGKQVSSLIGTRLVITRSPALAFLAYLTPLIYIGTWIIYLLEFVLGGMALPGPGIPIGAEVGNAQYTISLFGIIGWIVIILPLSIRFGRNLVKTLRSRLLSNETHLPLWILAAWAILHNLAYAFFLPIPGTASRYGTVNHLALWLALFIGLISFRTRPTWQKVLGMGLLLIASANTLYWNRVYDANLEHMLKVRIAAAEYVRDIIPSHIPVAAFDVGAMRFFTGRPITDLGGLIDLELGKVYASDRRIDRYLAEKGIRYVVLPGRSGTTEEGWFDFAREMGLTHSELFTLQLEQVFEIPYERWLLGYLSTNNYQATVTIYRLE